LLKRFIFATVLIIKIKKMKKNLRNILVLAMGLMTTVSFAQDWNVDSRTRMDKTELVDSEDNERATLNQRVTLGATWGGDDWGIHLSNDVNYTLGQDGDASMNIYEAYTSVNNLAMGYINLTAGRMALNYGSGALMSSSDFGDRNTWDGLKMGINNDFLGLTLGMSKSYDATTETASNLYVNASKAVSGLDVNLLYMMGSNTTDEETTSAMGLDLAYGMMDGALNLAVSYNMNSGDKMDGEEYLAEDMMNIGATYQVMDAMKAGVSYSSYGENGFDMEGTNMAGNWANGNMGYLGANDQDIAIDVAYALTNLSIGLGYHMVSNSVATEDSRSVMDLSVGYTISDNASLGLRYATDATSIASVDATTNYTWVTLSVRP